MPHSELSWVCTRRPSDHFATGFGNSSSTDSRKRTLPKSEKHFADRPQYSRLTVENLPILRDRLLEAISSLEGWGVRVPDLGRLRAAARVLDECIETGHYPADQSTLQKTVESIIVAQDFSQITAAIRPDAVERLAQDLQAAMGGTVDGQEKSRRPYQYQSQLWFGAAMARGGLFPKVPSPSKGGPDFFVCPYALRYGVEVKRPGKPTRFHGTISGARDQLAEGGNQGIIALDLTDSLDELGLRQFVEEIEDPIDLDLRLAYKTVVDEVANQIWDSGRSAHKPGYRRVIGLAVALRGWRWQMQDLSAPTVFSFFGMQSFSSTSGNVWGRAASDFFDLLITGLRKGGVHIHLAEYESSNPDAKPYYEDWGE